MTTNGKTNYLVFERDEPTGETVQTAAGTAHKMAHGQGYRDAGSGLLGYRCIGGVKAKDEEAAVQAVIRATRRIGAYAIVEATFLDFTQPVEGVDSETPQLNP
jgi:hypothetical protein